MSSFSAGDRLCVRRCRIGRIQVLIPVRQSGVRDHVLVNLPAFYLLDAVSKNVYEPYARHFATFVMPLFLETYEQVDQATRGKMEEMLLTWRTGAPNGKELFGIVPQVNIERGIWGGESSGPEVSRSTLFVVRFELTIICLAILPCSVPGPITDIQVASAQRVGIHSRSEGAQRPRESIRFRLTEPYRRFASGSQ